MATAGGGAPAGGASTGAGAGASASPATAKGGATAGNSGNKKVDFDLKSFGDMLMKIGATPTKEVQIDTAPPQLNFSDERIKKIFGDHSFPLECFKKINSVDFTFTDEAKEKLGEEGGIDDDEHIGVLAQDLEKVPVLKNSVITDERGLKKIDTNEMTLANTAAISDVAKELDDIKSAIKSLSEKIGVDIKSEENE